MFTLLTSFLQSHYLGLKSPTVVILYNEVILYLHVRSRKFSYNRSHDLQCKLCILLSLHSCYILYTNDSSGLSYGKLATTCMSLVVCHAFLSPFASLPLSFLSAFLLPSTFTSSSLCLLPLSNPSSDSKHTHARYTQLYAGMTTTISNAWTIITRSL